MRTSLNILDVTYNHKTCHENTVREIKLVLLEKLGASWREAKRVERRTRDFLNNIITAPETIFYKIKTSLLHRAEWITNNMDVIADFRAPVWNEDREDFTYTDRSDYGGDSDERGGGIDDDN